jgi:hypothetical protein
MPEPPSFAAARVVRFRPTVVPANAGTQLLPLPGSLGCASSVVPAEAGTQLFAAAWIARLRIFRRSRERGNPAFAAAWIAVAAQ